MFVRVLDQRPIPGEEEVPGSGAERYSDAQPHVERHEDEHKDLNRELY